MPTKQNILIAGRDSDCVTAISEALRKQEQLSVNSRLLVNGDHDPLQGLKSLPAIAVLAVSGSSKDELQAIAGYPAEKRPALVIVSGEEHSCVMRMAMQAGARDFLSYPINGGELTGSICRILKELKPSDADSENRITTFINAKGGSGSSFLAANYAHTAQTLGNRKTLLLDLDRQFAPLPQYLDISPQASLFDALYVVSELDELAVEGFISRHSSGLGVMASNFLLSDGEIGAQIDESTSLAALLKVLLRRHERLVAEVPRHLDEVGAAMLQASDRILLVLQQSVPDLRNASRLVSILTKELGIDPERIQPLVNRYNPKSTTTLDDIRKVLHSRVLHTMPNDFNNVSEAIDMGVPLAQIHPKSASATALHELHKALEGIEQEQSHGLLSRLMRK